MSEGLSPGETVIMDSGRWPTSYAKSLMEIGVEGKNPGNVAFQLRRRIKDRKLDIVSSLSRGSVYLERKR